MGRYNCIILGPARKNDPQVREANASEDILPGSIIELAAGEFALCDGSSVGKFYIAQEQYLAMNGVDDTYTEDEDLVLGLELEDDCRYAARIADSVNITALDTPLTFGAGGTLAIATSGAQVIAYADEVYNNNTGSSQLIRVRPAGSGSHVMA